MLHHSKCAFCNTNLLVWHPDATWSATKTDFAVCSTECLHAITCNLVLTGWRVLTDAEYTHGGNLYVHAMSTQNAQSTRTIRLDVASDHVCA